MALATFFWNFPFGYSPTLAYRVKLLLSPPPVYQAKYTVARNERWTCMGAKYVGTRWHKRERLQATPARGKTSFESNRSTVFPRGKNAFGRIFSHKHKRMTNIISMSIRYAAGGAINRAVISC